MKVLVPIRIYGGGAMALAYAMHALTQHRWPVLAVALIGGLLMPAHAGPVFAQEVASAIPLANGDTGGVSQVAPPAALVQPPVIILREGNLMSMLVLPAADEPPPGNSSLPPPATDFLSPRLVPNYGGYGSGFLGRYGGGYGGGDGHCGLYFVVSGSWCSTMTVTGTLIGAP